MPVIAVPLAPSRPDGGKKAWRLRYRLRGKQEQVTIGSYPTIPLIEARKIRERRTKRFTC